MSNVLDFAHRKWASLTLSFFLCVPIALFIAVMWVRPPGGTYSLKNLGLIASGIFVLLIWGCWFIVERLLSWLKSKPVGLSRRDYILLCLGLIPVVVAIYSGWTRYGGQEIPDRLLPKFEVEVRSSDESPVSGEVCILGIESGEGKKIQPEKQPASGFVLSGSWTLNSTECSYLLAGGTQGSLKFQYKARPGDVLQIVFRENKDSGKALVRINGELIAEADLHSELEGDNLVSVPVQRSRSAVSLWNGIGTAGWMGMLALLVMIFSLAFKETRFPPRIVSLFDLAHRFPWIGFVLLSMIAAVRFWPSGVSISPDVGYYLSLAKNLYYGNGYVNPDLSANIYRGPVFPLLISFSYVLFGESFRSAIILERIFWFLTILISYVLGRQLYNHRVGFLAASFILAAGVINQAFIRIWTDGPLTFAILALQLMFWQAFIGQRDAKWYAVMGGFMGITYLLKQTVIFIAPLPLLTWIIFSEYRTRQTFKKLLVFYLAFAVFYFGWEGYVYLAGGSSGQITGTLQTGINFLSYISRGSSAAATGQSLPLPGTAPSLIMSFLDILSTFYTRDILRFFKIAIVFPLALVFLLYQATVRKIKPDIFLALGIFLYSPLILVQAVVNFGFRQNLYFYCIGLICIAAMLDRLFSRLSFKGLSTAVVFTVAISLICIQLSGGNYDFAKAVPIRNVKALPYLSTYREIAAWVDGHVAFETRIMIPRWEGNYLHVLTTGNRQFEMINTCMGETDFSPAMKCIPPYISFWVYKGTTDPNEPRDLFQGISEPMFLSTIRDKDVEYVFVTPSIYSLYRYLVVHPDFEEVDIIDNIAIFRVIGPVHSIADYQNIEWEPCIGRGTSTYLKNLKDTDPKRFEMRLQNQLEPWMGLDREDLDAFMNWRGCQFEVNFPGSYRVD
jgi:4-amino-4-deoxy-L-arabinose transferase-like glycosyltransferase